MSCCAIGSVKGYDELFPHLLDLVNESKKYRIPESEGIIPAKRLLNKLHHEMTLHEFTELHVHQDEDFITLHRINPTSQKGILLVLRCAFKNKSQKGIKYLKSPIPNSFS